MTRAGPADTLRRLIAAINARDVGGAMSLYHPDATFVVEPGKPSKGPATIRAAIEGFLTTKPTLDVNVHTAVEADDVALCCTRWSLNHTGLDGSVVQRAGRGAVVLPRRANGAWMIAIENPWADVAP